MELSFHQKQDLCNHGFVRIPGVVPKVMIEAARKEINHLLGKENESVQQLSSADVIKNLFNQSPAIEYVESLLGEGMFDPVQAGQIALRFPSLEEKPDPLIGHLDGMYYPGNGVPKGTIQNFTMLVVILLSDVTYSGNFTVWPGSHHLFEKYFQEYGPEKLLEHEVVDLMKDVPYSFEEPYQTMANAGDIILCHYNTAHTGAPNLSSEIRYATIYRIKHIENDNSNKRSMADIWMHWPGIKKEELT